MSNSHGPSGAWVRVMADLEVWLKESGTSTPDVVGGLRKIPGFLNQRNQPPVTMLEVVSSNAARRLGAEADMIDYLGETLAFFHLTRAMSDEMIQLIADVPAMAWVNGPASKLTASLRPDGPWSETVKMLVDDDVKCAAKAVRNTLQAQPQPES